MNKILTALLFLLALFMSAAFFPEGGVAAMICVGAVLLVIYIIGLMKIDEDTKLFFTNIFVGALLVRVLLASIIFAFDLQDSFGPDARFYDFVGNAIASNWWQENSTPLVINQESGWGMVYIVGAIYFLIGQNPLAGQVVVAILGATTSIMAFICARQIFHNNRVAKYSAIFVAFFPGMIIWTSQLIKDGLIMFLLLLVLMATLKLQEQFKISWIFYLLISLLGISVLRFYVFFVVIAAVLGGLILGMKASIQGLIYRFIAFTLIGLSLSALGILQDSERQVDKYINLEQLQSSRQYAAQAANSGLDIGEEDVSTTSGLISALPYGLVVLFLAPFPWQVQNLTQVLTMPEMILWWLSLPFLFSGLVYTIKNRFRESVSLLFFTLILSLSYAVYQGNLGTLYRQRAQIQVVLLIFTAVGVAIHLEKKENIKLKRRVRPIHQTLPLTK